MATPTKETSEAFAGIFAEIFSIPIKEKFGSYSFKVNNIEEINFNKINDDLSYADPFRIIEYNSEVWAIVHHSINDKKTRSVLNDKVHNAIIMGHSKISKKEIAIISRQIKGIKLAQWYNKDFKKGATLEVKVTKIK